MPTIRAMQIFISVADSGSFASGARQLDLSPPVATRAIATLEQELGVRLLDRTTRSVRITAAGAQYLEDVRQILDRIAAAGERAVGSVSEPLGALTVTAPVMFGRKYVVPATLAYLERFPQTDVNMLLLDRVVNLIDEGIDIGIRIGPLPDSSLRARRVGAVRLVLCASPDYLKRHGKPKRPSDLTTHDIIDSRTASRSAPWQFAGSSKRPPRLKSRLRVNSNDAAIEAAKSGFGITRVLSYQVAEEIAHGDLELVLPEYEPPIQAINLVHRQDKYTPARLRAFIDLMAVELSSNPALKA